MKIYLAGAETFVNQKFYEQRFLSNQNIFVSYFNISKTTLAKLPKDTLSRIVDSGAHSFFASTNEDIGFPLAKSKKKQIPPDEYIRKYILWIQENYNHYDYFVELDIQELVGYDKVLKWREMYKEAGIIDKMIYVYHSSNTWKEFEEMVAEVPSRYIGIEGVRTNRKPLNYLKYIKHCYFNKVKIHAFAMIKKAYLMKYPFYSVDSSSFSSLYRFGSTALVFNQGALKGLPHITYKYGTEIKNAIKQRVEDTIRAYNELEQFYTQLWEKRGVIW